MHIQHFDAPTTRRAFLLGLPSLIPALRALDDPPHSPALFRFFQINDLHYVSDDCGLWFREVTAQMRASAPDAAFCLLCGDLSDLGDQPSLAAVAKIFGTLDIPIHPVPGNHDYTPTESREHYDAVFPGKLNHHFDHAGWQFLGLDTTMGTKWDKTTIAPATLDWLDTTLPALDPSKPTVAFTHFPLAPGVAMTPLNAPALLERLLKLRLIAAFSGHWHGLSEKKTGAALLATSRCCARVRNNADGSPLKGWWVCEAHADATLTRRFIEFKPPAGIPITDNAAAKNKPK